MTDGDMDLSDLRAEIDRIDEAVQDLLIRRTEVVGRISATKRGSAVKLRPGREARILRALVARHRGAFPKPELVRVWREILSTQLRLQGPFSVAVYGPEEETGYWPLARDQYGAYTPMSVHQSPWRVVEAVARGAASVGILPLPRLDDEDPWWRHLATQGIASGAETPPRIIVKLPFAPGRQASPPGADGLGLEALVIAPMGQDQSGDDQTYLVLDVDREMTTRTLRDGLQEVGIPASLVARWHDRHPPERWLHLLLSERYLAPDDAPLDLFAERLGIRPGQIIVIGGYAAPLGTAELADEIPADIHSNAEKIA